MRFRLWKWSADQEDWLCVGSTSDDALARWMFIQESGAKQLRDHGQVVAWSGFLANPELPDEVTIPDELPENFS